MRASRVLKIELEYNQKLTPEQVALLEAASGQKISGEPTPDNPEVITVGWDSRSLMVSWEEIEAIKIPFQILEITKYDKLPEAIEQRDAPAPVNEKCNVIVAGVSMLHIDEVNVVLDACTELIQSELSVGWRILAICVQPDQRRPDYVLGRSSKGVNP